MDRLPVGEELKSALRHLLHAMALGKSGGELVLTPSANLTGGLSDSSLTPIQGRGATGGPLAPRMKPRIWLHKRGVPGWR